jgi:hypothetical protein
MDFSGRSRDRKVTVRSKSTVAETQAVLEQARREREGRQLERARTIGATRLQALWRSHAARRLWRGGEVAALDARLADVRKLATVLAAAKRGPFVPPVTAQFALARAAAFAATASLDDLARVAAVCEVLRGGLAQHGAAPPSIGAALLSTAVGAGEAAAHQQTAVALLSRLLSSPLRLLSLRRRRRGGGPIDAATVSALRAVEGLTGELVALQTTEPATAPAVGAVFHRAATAAACRGTLLEAAAAAAMVDDYASPSAAPAPDAYLLFAAYAARLVLAATSSSLLHTSGAALADSRLAAALGCVLALPAVMRNVAASPVKTELLRLYSGSSPPPAVNPLGPRH